MKAFGETIRELRSAQGLGLREIASKAGISPAHLSRIERGKEQPPSPEIIKVLAKELAADPEVLFRLATPMDPVIVKFLHTVPEAMAFVRFLSESKLSATGIEELMELAQRLSSEEYFAATQKEYESLSTLSTVG